MSSFYTLSLFIESLEGTIGSKILLFLPMPRLAFCLYNVMFSIYVNILNVLNSKFLHRFSNIIII